jgi:hypothetical protein
VSKFKKDFGRILGYFLEIYIEIITQNIQALSMEVTAIHAEGALSIHAIINGGIREEDVVRINLMPNESITISDRFATSPELVSAENEGLISTETYETGDLTAMNREKTIKVLTSDILYQVIVQDQTNRALSLYFGRLGDLTTLSAQSNPEDTTITLTDTTGFVDGKTVGIFSIDDPNTFYIGTQLGAPAGSVITVDTPIDQVLPIGSSIASVDTNMAVDGSVTTQVYQIGPVGAGSTQTIHISRVMGHIRDETEMDDSKFGGMSALTNGIVLRHNNTVIENIWNAKSNGDLALICDNTSYAAKAKQGEFGFSFRNTFAGQENYGVAIELVAGDILEILIQDDLTDLVNFEMLAQGHYETT